MGPQDSAQETPAVPINPGGPIPHKTNFIVPILSIFALLLICSTTFFAYQDIQLQKQVASLTTLPTNTPAKIPATATPSASTSATPDVTANWQTYTNTKYGYSVQYPATFSLSDDSSQADMIILYPAGFDSLTPSQMQTAPTIVIETATSAASPQTLVSSLEAPGYSNIRNKTNASVGDIQGIQFTFNNTQAGSGDDQLETIISFKNKVLLFINLDDATNEPDVKIYNQILSTFQFTQ